MRTKLFLSKILHKGIIKQRKKNRICEIFIAKKDNIKKILNDF